ncbi:hypothetical protein JB92DRAFT_3093597 [Gautieria morchelliformis]|nr:hypothetical protein JB92DRAFT_3093597 [Gautieria morchelliformis]
MHHSLDKNDKTYWRGGDGEGQNEVGGALNVLGYACRNVYSGNSPSERRLVSEEDSKEKKAGGEDEGIGGQGGVPRNASGEGRESHQLEWGSRGRSGKSQKLTRYADWARSRSRGARFYPIAETLGYRRPEEGSHEESVSPAPIEAAATKRADSTKPMDEVHARRIKNPGEKACMPSRDIKGKRGREKRRSTQKISMRAASEPGEPKLPVQKESAAIEMHRAKSGAYGARHLLIELKSGTFNMRS